MANITGINHIALITGNMDETVRFWRDLLGLHLVLTMGHPGYRHYFFRLAPGNFIAFFEWPGAEAGIEKDHGAPIAGKYNFDHISLAVESRQALWDIKDKLEAAGVWASEVVDHGFICSLYSFDPNNIPIEFSYLCISKDLKDCPVFADKGMTKIVAEGANPNTEAWPKVEESTPEKDKITYPGQGKELFQE